LFNHWNGTMKFWITLIATWAVSLSSLAATPLVNPSTLEDLLANPQVRVVDIREPQYYRSNHVPGSVNAPYDVWRGPARNPGELPAVPKLTALLKHEDLWLRVKAAEALAQIGKPAISTLPGLLEQLAQGPTKADPRGMEQRYLCSSVFGVMLKNSVEGVDRDLLYKAVAAGLKNQDGRARGQVGNIYQQLNYEEIKPLLPAIHEAIVKPAPSGIMFADGVRLSGLELLAQHRIREGMALSLDTMDIERWGKKNRIDRCLKALATYGGAAKPLLPRIRQLEQDLVKHSEARGLQPTIDQVRKLISDIESSEEAPELIHLSL
jgi:hypothetical protein